MSNELSSNDSELTHADRGSGSVQDPQALGMFDYYESILKFKKRFVKNLEAHCDKRREIYKIWAHWLIRVLSRRPQNPHPLIRVDPNEIDPDILKHMQQNGVNHSRSLTIYRDLIDQYNKLYSLFGQEHEELLENPNMIKEIQTKINLTYLPNCGIYFLRIDNSNLNIKLTPDKFYRLYTLYRGPSELFLFYMFEYIFNYYLLDGKSLQWSIPQEVFNSLKKYDLQGELFASPINHYYPQFYSLFEVDRFFSSQGNFFSLDPTTQSLKGLYEVNPPFIEEIFSKSTLLILEHLEKQSGALGFVYIMPGWVDLEGYNCLHNSSYYLGELTLEKGRHCYFQTSNNKHITASFETVIILVGNEAFKSRFDVKQVLEDVKSSFIKPRLFHTEPLSETWV